MVGDKLQRARTMVANGLTVRKAATRLKVGKTALLRGVARVGCPALIRVAAASRLCPVHLSRTLRALPCRDPKRELGYRSFGYRAVGKAELDLRQRSRKPAE